MDEVRYTISEAAKKLQVESHVLRYWEEELGLKIGRTDMGHRFYTDDDIQLFLCIQKLKNEGMLLRDLKFMIPELTAARKRLNSAKPEKKMTAGSTTSACTQADEPHEYDSLTECNAVSYVWADSAQEDGTQTLASSAADSISSEKTFSESATLDFSQSANPNSAPSAAADSVRPAVSGAEAFGAAAAKSSAMDPAAAKSAAMKSAAPEPAAPESDALKSAAPKSDAPESDALKSAALESAALKPAALEPATPEPEVEVIQVTQLEQVRSLIGDVLTDVVSANNETLKKDISRKVTADVIREMDFLFQANERREEEHYRKLDTLIRQQQASRRESARETPLGKLKKLLT